MSGCTGQALLDRWAQVCVGEGCQILMGGGEMEVGTRELCVGLPADSLGLSFLIYTMGVVVK